MKQLGNGLSAAEHGEDALSVERPSCLWSGALAHQFKTSITQSNIANSYAELGRDEEALRLCSETYTLDV